MCPCARAHFLEYLSLISLHVILYVCFAVAGSGLFACILDIKHLISMPTREFLSAAHMIYYNFLSLYLVERSFCPNARVAMKRSAVFAMGAEIKVILFALAEGILIIVLVE